MNFVNAFMTFFAFLLLTLFTRVGASPIDGVALSKKDIFVPRIIEPTASTVWKSGEIRKITWDTSNAPKQITNGVGLVLIRFQNTSTPFVLANGFNILDGSVDIRVPLVQTRPDYSIILLGDSGNDSPNFEIIGIPE